MPAPDPTNGLFTSEIVNGPCPSEKGNAAAAVAAITAKAKRWIRYEEEEFRDR
jgi:hypothetical protein